MWDFLRCYLFINLKIKRLLKYRCQLLQRNRGIGWDSSNMLHDFHFHLWRRYFVGAFRKFCPAGHPFYIFFAWFLYTAKNLLQQKPTVTGKGAGLATGCSFSGMVCLWHITMSIHVVHQNYQLYQISWRDFNVMKNHPLGQLKPWYSMRNNNPRRAFEPFFQGCQSCGKGADRVLKIPWSSCSSQVWSIWVRNTCRLFVKQIRLQNWSDITWDQDGFVFTLASGKTAMSDFLCTLAAKHLDTVRHPRLPNMRMDILYNDI